MRSERLVIGATIALGLIGLGVVAASRFVPWPSAGSEGPHDAASGAVTGWEAIVAATSAEDWPRVEALLRDWIDVVEADGKGRLMLGHLLASTGRSGEAARVLGGVTAKDAAFAEARTVLGQMALDAGDALRAEVAFRQAAAADPSAEAPLGRLIFLLSAELRTAEARDVLWDLYHATEDPRVLVDLTLEAAKDEVDVRGVAPEVERFLGRSPDDPFLRRAAGLAALWRGMPSEALSDLEGAADTLADDPLGRFALAECRSQLGLPVEVPEVLGPVPETPADASRWWVFRGRLEEADRRLDAAIESFREAVEANPGSPEAHHRLSRALARSGDDDGASALAMRAEELRSRWDNLRRLFTRVRGDGFEADPARFVEFAERCRSVGLDAEAIAWLLEARALDPGVDAPELAAIGPFPVARSRPRRIEAAMPTLRGPSSMAGDVETSTPSNPPRFEDIAASSGIAYQYDDGSRDDLSLADTMGGGVGLFDYDGDGRLDIYFVNGCAIPYDRDDPPRPNRLYRNRVDGTFEDVTDEAGVGGLGYGMGCAVGDIDNDGDEDLFVTGLDRTVLYRNRGDGTFEDVTDEAGVASERWTSAAGFGDLDGDGDLDLYVVTYVEGGAEARSCRDHAGKPIHCSPGQYPAQQDHLFRNDGDGTFTDIGPEAGIEAPGGRGLGLAIADLDGDALLDLYVANDASADFAFRNLGGLRFEESGALWGLAVDGSGHATASMGVVADDLTGDGLLDLFHTNFLNEPNTMHRNLGGGQFADATLSAGLAAPSLAVTGFGAAALDIDNDGRLDLFVANGHVDDQPWVNSPIAQLPQCHMGRDDGRFLLTPRDAFPYLGRPVVGRGLAVGDLDQDGLLDLVVVHRGAPAAVLRNRTEGGHWLGLRLDGRASGRTAVGARVAVMAGGRRQVRFLASGTSYLSSNDPRLWFGLGDSSRLDRVEIRWPSGLEQAFQDVAADRLYGLVEGGQLWPIDTDSKVR